MSAIEKVTAHYDRLGTIKTYVPEWDETIYNQPITLHNRSRIAKATGDSDTDFAIRALIELACDKDGNKLYSIEDLQALRTKADAKVIERVVVQMTKTPSIEEQKGN